METIKKLKPREKFLKLGGDKLSEVELLALILQVGNKKYGVNVLAQMLIEKYESFTNLINQSLDELMENNGIGITKAIKIKSIYYINQYLKNEKTNLTVIQKPQDIYKYMAFLETNEEENVYIICLNIKKEIIASRQIFKGAISSVMFSPREIFKTALEFNSKYICLIHNHPSGDVTPSNADLESTNFLIEASGYIGVSILDHVIIGKNKYFSFKEHNLL